MGLLKTVLIGAAVGATAVVLSDVSKAKLPASFAVAGYDVRPYVGAAVGGIAGLWLAKKLD